MTVTMRADGLIVDFGSRVDFKVGDIVVLVKDYAGHKRGTHLRVVDMIECSTGDYLRYNARVVYEDEPNEDQFFWRTLPAEHLARVPRIGEITYFFLNHGDRPAKCLAVIGHEALWDYEMPGGRVFLRIENIGRGSRSVSDNALPKKWRRAIEED